MNATSARIVPLWIDRPSGFLAATWFWPSDEQPQRSLAVLMIPGVAMEDRTITVGFLPLAERLNQSGIAAMALSPRGTGNSSDDLSDASIVDEWADDVRCAIALVRASGFERVVVVALRLAGLVMTELGDVSLDGLVLWSPVFSGRRYARELAVLAATGRAGRIERQANEPLMIGTFQVSTAILDRIKQLASTSRPLPTAKVLLVDDPDRIDPAGSDALRQRGAAVDTRLSGDTARWLHVHSDAASVPRSDIDAVVSWVSGIPCSIFDELLPAPDVASEHSFERNGTMITERFVRFSAADLVGIYSMPCAPGAVDAKAWVIVTSVQPGKAFNDLARDEASNGRSSLRFDLSSNGLSPCRRGQGWGELNGRFGPIDAGLAFEWMRPRHVQVSMLGFCAGAVASLNISPDDHLRAIVAINPPIFIPRHGWRTSDGMSGSALWKMVDRHDRRRIGETLRWKYRRDWFRWSPSVRMIGRHRRSRTRVLIQFDDTDPGYMYLRRVASAALRQSGHDGSIEVREYADVGHLLDRPSGRRQVLGEAMSFGSR